MKLKYLSSMTVYIGQVLRNRPNENHSCWGKDLVELLGGLLLKMFIALWVIDPIKYDDKISSHLMSKHLSKSLKKTGFESFSNKGWVTVFIDTDIGFFTGF